VLKGIELIHGGDAWQAVALPNRLIALDQVEHLGFEHEEAAIDPGTITLGLLFKGKHPAALELQRAEAARGLHGGEGGPTALLLVKGDGFSDVHIANAIAIGEAEGAFALEIGRHAPEAAAGERFGAGVDQGDAPGFSFAMVHLHLVGGHVKGDIAGMQKVVGEVFLDQVALVAKANNEIVDAMGGIDLEDVPEDRQAADFHHWFGAEAGFFAEAGAEAAGENYGYHSNP